MIALNLSKADQKALDQFAEKIGALSSTMNKSAIESGAALVGVQEVLARAGCKGQFTAWIEEHCSFCRSTAYKFIAIYKAFGNSPVSGRFDTEAMAELCKNEPARKQALELARKGHLISHEKAREIIASHSPSPEPEDGDPLDERPETDRAPRIALGQARSADRPTSQRAAVPAPAPPEQEEFEPAGEFTPIAVAEKPAEPNTIGEALDTVIGCIAEVVGDHKGGWLLCFKEKLIAAVNELEA